MHHHRAPLAAAVSAVLVTTLLALAPGARAATAGTEPVAGQRRSGGDISWPNCPKGMGIASRRSQGMPLPLGSASFVVVGLTNGPGFVPNPCLADQVTWARSRAVWTAAYAMTTYPTSAQRAAFAASGPWSALTAAGQLRNAGYQQALSNVASMRATGLDVPLVWVDVEPYPTHPWPANRARNRDVVRGVVRGYEDSGYRVGFYSYDGGWRAVVGAWRQPAYPTWVPVGGGAGGWTRASRACGGASFSGGPVMMAQWVEGGRDRDITCAALHGRAAAWHPLTNLLARRLQLGSRGTAVIRLQRALGMTGRQVDGRFGARTRRWLISFQNRHGLAPTGITGQDTWRALGAGQRLPERPSRLAEAFRAY
ncbi:MAG: hypothetical protein QOE19_1786 [Actinomycetota bacterium]|nr:hypothetical protein [Actinomycetota bacterium]